ncbi:MAG TPA: ABA4-like family protein [Nannocystis sp.]|jgi:hypothetical protein
MSLASIFSAANTTAALGWLLMIFAPRWRITDRVVLSGALALGLAALYTALLIAHFGDGEGGFSSLDEVVKLFRQPAMVLTGWVHYLAFDLFIGAWEARDARRRGVPHLALVPCLLLTFMFGPVGLLVYRGVRVLLGRGRRV